MYPRPLGPPSRSPHNPTPLRHPETVQDYMVSPPHPTTTFSACLVPIKNLNQRISLLREVRNAETKGNSLGRLNNNKVVIKHRQGPLVLSQGL